MARPFRGDYRLGIHLKISKFGDYENKQSEKTNFKKKLPDQVLEKPFQLQFCLM